MSDLVDSSPSSSEPVIAPVDTAGVSAPVVLSLQDRVSALSVTAEDGSQTDEQKIMLWIRDHLAAIRGMLDRADSFQLSDEGVALIAELKSTL